MGKLYFFTIILIFSLILFAKEINNTDLPKRFDLTIFDEKKIKKNDIHDSKIILVSHFRNKDSDFSFLNLDISLFYRLQKVQDNQQYNFVVQKLIQDLQNYKIKKIYFYDFTLTSDLILYLNQNNIDFETYGFNVADNNYIIPEFDKLFRILEVLNYDLSDEIYYLTNPVYFIPSVNDFKTELEDYFHNTNKKIIHTIINNDRELISFLNKLNKKSLSEKKHSIIFVNLDYLYDEQNNRLRDCCYCYISDIFKIYSLRNIPIFLNYSLNNRCLDEFFIYQVDFEKLDFDLTINLNQFFNSRFARAIDRNELVYFLNSVKIKE